MSDQPMKHGHQHLPLGPDPIPGGPVAFRALLANHTFAVGSDNQRQVEFDWWEFEDEDVFSEGTIDGSGYLESWRVKQPGLYLVNAAVNWHNGSTWETTLILNDPYRNTVVTHGHTGDSFDDHYTLCVLRDFWIFWPGSDFFDPTSPPATAEMALSLNQDSGSDQDVDRCEIIVYRLPIFDLHTPTADLGFPAPGRIINGGF